MSASAIPTGEPTASTHQPASGGKLRPVQLAAIIFLTVSGGPYGLEPLFSYVGDHGAILLLVVTPILWDIPTILTVLELNSMMPVTGGYYQWVKHALGIRWAFFEGWWTWLYTFIDLAIYPVLFVGYAAFFFPEINAYRVPVCLMVIWLSAILNILGIVPVGKTSLVLGIGVLIPFLALFIVLLTRHTTPISIPAPSLHGLGFSPVAMGLYTVMWNFIGWDNATTYAGEVASPVRSYLLSVTMAFLLIVGIYLLAALAVHQSGIDPAVLTEGGFPVLGVMAGGRWLGILLAAGGMASTIGLYSAVLLSVSRIPQVMASDNLLPKKLCALHPRFKTPYMSIIASSCIVSILILWTFSDLVIMDIMLYGAGLSLEFITLLVLRIREPHRHRPFAIPLNKKGLLLMIALPLTVYGIALSGAIYSSGRMAVPVFVALGMLLSAEIAWRLISWRKVRRVVLLLLLTAGATTTAAAAPRFRTLALYENGGHHIEYSRAARRWLDKLAADSNFTIDYITTPAGIDDAALARYQLIIQLDYAPYAWPTAAIQAFQQYIEKGRGGWIGFHHATLLGEFDGYPIWQWFSDFMGGIRWKSYIAGFAAADVKVEDQAHPSMTGLPTSFRIEKDEWYTYNKSPRPNVHVIASVDESSYTPDSPVKMGDHPVIWTNDHVAARNIYIFMGHAPELFDNSAYTTLFRNAIFWAAANNPTAAVSTARPTAAAADSGTFLLHKFQQRLGKETYSLARTDAARIYSVNFKFVDRGSAVPLKTTVELTPDQEPLRLITHGSTSRMSTINDSISIHDNTAVIRVDDSVYTLPVKENTFPVAGYSPATTQMLLLRYWNKHQQPRIIHALPGGDISISEQGSDSFTMNGRPLILKRYLISGLIWGSELLWADENGQLFCLITNDAEGDKVEVMLEPYESLLPAFIDKAAVYGMQLFDDLTKQQTVRHRLIAIRNASHLDVENGRRTPGMTILLEDGKIKSMTPGSGPLPAGAFTIDAKGRTVMPGLWDMHAHFEQAEWGPAYLAAGVTTVRDCGNEFGYINAIKNAIDGGKGIGPHILKAGIIDGKGAMSLGVIQVSTAEEAVRAVQQYKDNGFIQIKIYSSVSPAMVSAICNEAHRLGLTVTGHIPEGMTLMQGVDSGMDMVNHEQYINAILKKRADRSIDYEDSANRKVMDFIRDRHVVIDPTLSVFEWVFRSLADPITNVEPAFYEIPLPLQTLFTNTGMPAKQAANYRPLMKNMEEQVGIMFHKGIPIVAGTDMGIPGYSLYRELELYVEGGLTPQEALQTATIIPARVLKRDSFSGSLAIGKDADLIIVDGDPLRNIHDIRKVMTVIKGETIYDPGQLHHMVGFK